MLIRFSINSILWALFILLLCLAPSSELPEFDIWKLLSFDKIVHASLFSIQVLLIIVGLKRQYFSYRLRYYAKTVAFLLGSLYGFLIEILQLISNTGRTFDLLDVIADIIGCVIGLILFRMIYGKEFSY